MGQRVGVWPLIFKLPAWPGGSWIAKLRHLGKGRGGVGHGGRRGTLQKSFGGLKSRKSLEDSRPFWSGWIISYSFLQWRAPKRGSYGACGGDFPPIKSPIPWEVKMLQNHLGRLWDWRARALPDVCRRKNSRNKPRAEGIQGQQKRKGRCFDSLLHSLLFHKCFILNLNVLDLFCTLFAAVQRLLWEITAAKRRDNWKISKELVAFDTLVSDREDLSILGQNLLQSSNYIDFLLSYNGVQKKSTYYTVYVYALQKKYAKHFLAFLFGSNHISSSEKPTVSSRPPGSKEEMTADEKKEDLLNPDAWLGTKHLLKFDP